MVFDIPSTVKTSRDLGNSVNSSLPLVPPPLSIHYDVGALAFGMRREGIQYLVCIPPTTMNNATVSLFNACSASYRCPMLTNSCCSKLQMSIQTHLMMGALITRWISGARQPVAVLSQRKKMWIH